MSWCVVNDTHFFIIHKVYLVPWINLCFVCKAHSSTNCHFYRLVRRNLYENLSREFLCIVVVLSCVQKCSKKNILDWFCMKDFVSVPVPHNFFSCMEQNVIWFYLENKAFKQSGTWKLLLFYKLEWQNIMVEFYAPFLQYSHVHFMTEEILKENNVILIFIQVKSH